MTDIMNIALVIGWATAAGFFALYILHRDVGVRWRQEAEQAYKRIYELKEELEEEQDLNEELTGVAESLRTSLRESDKARELALKDLDLDSKRIRDLENLLAGAKRESEHQERRIGLAIQYIDDLKHHLTGAGFVVQDLGGLRVSIKSEEKEE